MALKSYAKITLNDNWYEDRAPPLKGGVLADNGKSEYTSTQRSVHVIPEKYWNEKGSSRAERERRLVLQKGALATTMVQPHNLSETSRPRSIPGPNHGPWTIVPKAPESEYDRHLRTTAQDGYGIPDRPSATAYRKLREPDAMFAGSTKLERSSGLGMKTGAIGELFWHDDEPQHDTASQRSWLSYNDPLIKFKHEGIPQAKQTFNTGLPIGEQKYNYDTSQSFSKTRNISRANDHVASTLHRAGNVYMDEGV